MRQGGKQAMFDTLLTAKEKLLRENNRNDFECFAKSVQKLKKDMEALGIKPTKEKLYGRPYQSQ
ncbi:hypothetical protein H1043_09345 [Thermoactinomyces vulgaris]|uniref:Uncharacterized protein n=1 Tax=Thermoactinomyces vulgaris TaxID=2026 RepID=A0ABS0QJP7_THEVU|nr:hypothetical protein [Thermoactinomyces vulgaris]MBA4551949.1 hypothetical protein [Thermoactinomyces vulgaris]MBA4596771.1 hypothetical protein [Thermoactinomyces vulgaris]MBH8589504.1 hypothetical protein [Thermoactinomyces vulgaris]RMA98011.1 hypothetical protein ATH33_2487 [Thermoactinomyces vulgaris]